jgi:hypothetical protein
MKKKGLSKLSKRWSKKKLKIKGNNIVVVIAQNERRKKMHQQWQPYTVKSKRIKYSHGERTRRRG